VSCFFSFRAYRMRKLTTVFPGVAAFIFWRVLA
jgi:hypothetical protein